MSTDTLCRRFRSRGLSRGSLALAGCVLLAGAPSGAWAEPQVGPNFLVNDRSDLPGKTQSEVSIAVFGPNIAFGWNDSKGLFEEGVSRTGVGQSAGDWDHFVDEGEVPVPTGSRYSFDPSLAQCGDGTFYYAGIGTSGILVSRGDLVDGTIEWQEAQIAVAGDGSGYVLDKEYLACDEVTGNVYMSYVRANFFSGTGTVEFIRSTDAGATWTDRRVLHPEELVPNNGAYPAAGPDGTVCVAWQHDLFGSNPAIEMRCSTDEGLSFKPLRTVVDFIHYPSDTPPGSDEPKIHAMPSIDIDQSTGPNRGTIYVTYTDGDLDVRDVKLLHSGDLGASWSPPVRVNDNGGLGTHEYFPWVNVDSNGRVGVLWYSNDAAITDVFLDVSDGSGGPDTIVTDVSTDWAATERDTGKKFGDYINLQSSDGYFHAAWADGRHGDPDVFYAAIRMDDLVGVRTRLLSLPRTGEATVPSASPGVVLEVAGQQENLGQSPRLLLDNGNVAASMSDTQIPLTLTPIGTTLTPESTVLYYEIDLAPLCAQGSSDIFRGTVRNDAGSPLAAASRFAGCTQ